MAYYEDGRQESSAVPAPVNAAYAVPYAVHFQIDKKVRYTIADGEGVLQFDVKKKTLPSLHSKRVLRDSSKTALVTLKKKVVSLHERWWAYRGTNENDMLFVMSTSSVFQTNPSFHVFLSTNETSKPDFILKGKFVEHNYSILYKGVPIAEVHKDMDVPSMMDRDQYGVTVFPGIDQSFIASLVALVDLVKHR